MNIFGRILGLHDWTYVYQKYTTVFLGETLCRGFARFRLYGDIAEEWRSVGEADGMWELLTKNERGVLMEKIHKEGENWVLESGVQ